MPTLFDEPLEPARLDVTAELAGRAQAPPPGTAARPGPAPPPGTAARPGPVPPAAPPVPSPPTLLAVDGDSLAHRAFHAYPPGNGRGGPVRGFLNMLATVCAQVAVDAIVVGFDSREHSVRRERYPPYKAQRDDKDARLLDMLLALPELLGELGVEVVVARGWEADDVIASAATTAEAAGWRCAVATSDRDALCLVSEHTTVLRLGGGPAVAVTPQRLRADYRIGCGQYLEYAAVRGDPSDNLLGVPGIGPARAAALLAQYDTVEAAVADPIGCRSVLGAAVGQVLVDDLSGSSSVFRRNMDLMRPRRDLAVSLGAARRRLRPEVIADRLAAIGVGGLAARLATAFGARPERVPLPDGPPA